jgi:hypothetical protein
VQAGEDFGELGDVAGKCVQVGAAGAGVVASCAWSFGSRWSGSVMIQRYRWRALGGSGTGGGAARVARNGWR